MVIAIVGSKGWVDRETIAGELAKYDHKKDVLVTLDCVGADSIARAAGSTVGFDLLQFSINYHKGQKRKVASSRSMSFKKMIRTVKPDVLLVFGFADDEEVWELVDFAGDLVEKVEIIA